MKKNQINRKLAILHCFTLWIIEYGADKLNKLTNNHKTLCILFIYMNKQIDSLIREMISITHMHIQYNRFIWFNLITDFEGLCIIVRICLSADMALVHLYTADFHWAYHSLGRFVSFCGLFSIDLFFMLLYFLLVKIMFDMPVLLLLLLLLFLLSSIITARHFNIFICNYR